MHGTSKYKVPGGKLVEARVEYSGKIDRVEILGDFFLYPEEDMVYIERAMAGIDKDTDEKKIAERIREIVDKRGMELIGVNPEAIAKAVRMAVEQ
jgi:lipoate---protein ligase